MLTAHSTNITAAGRSRPWIVARHLSWVGSLTALLPDSGDDRRRRRFAGHHALDHDRGARIRRHEVQVRRREPLDALRRLERFDLQPQMAVRRLLVTALLLHLLEAVAVLQELDALPPGKEEHAHEEHAEGHRSPLLAQPPLVDLPDDGVVPYVFLDGVFECFCG